MKDFNKMKVAELRKYVSENNIFSGGLSTLKKKDIIDKIYDSEFYYLNCKPIDELNEKELLEHKLKELENKLKPVEPKQEEVPAVEEGPAAVEEVPAAEEVNLDERIQNAVQDALQKQREELMSKLFG